MKIQFALLAVLASLIAPALSFACGNPSEGFQGDLSIAKKAAQQPLSCEIKGEKKAARLGIFAIYRCLGSPSQLVLRVDNKSEMQIDAISEDSSGQFVLKSAASTITCKLNIEKAEHEDVALEVVKAIFGIGTKGSEGTIDTKVVSSRMDKDNVPNVVETFKIEALKRSGSHEPSTATFIYEVELLNGMPWSVKTTCPKCS